MYLFFFLRIQIAAAGAIQGEDMLFECDYCLKKFENKAQCPQCGGKEIHPVPGIPGGVDEDDPLTRSEKVVIRQFGTIDIGCGCHVDYTR